MNTVSPLWPGSRAKASRTDGISSLVGIFIIICRKSLFYNLKKTDSPPKFITLNLSQIALTVNGSFLDAASENRFRDTPIVFLRRSKVFGISKEPDGAFNEKYCKWCCADGRFIFKSIGELTDFLVGHMSNENPPPEQARTFTKRNCPAQSLRC